MNKKCIQCSNNKNEPCPLALERIYAIQGSKKKIDVDIDVGCPWFVNSSEYNYSFWEYAKTLDEPIPDKDICNLLLIDQNTLESTYTSAINKLKQIKDSPELQEFKDVLISKINSQMQDNTIYLPEEFAIVISSSNQEEKHQYDSPLLKEKNKKIRKGFGMPIHRDGKKIDLYGLYTKKKRLQSVKKNDKKNKK